MLVVLRGNINADNSIVKFIIDTADAISGPFSRDDGIFYFTGKNAESKNALLNWGIAAIVYLLIGRVLANLIAPEGRPLLRPRAVPPASAAACDRTHPRRCFCRS